VAVSIMPTGNYARLIAGSFRHARIVHAVAGAALDLPDRSSLYFTEFGVVVQTPDRSPNKVHSVGVDPREGMRPAWMPG
jgi:hypothetical protein